MLMSLSEYVRYARLCLDMTTSDQSRPASGTFSKLTFLSAICRLITSGENTSNPTQFYVFLNSLWTGVDQWPRHEFYSANNYLRQIHQIDSHKKGLCDSIRDCKAAVQSLFYSTVNDVPQGLIYLDCAVEQWKQSKKGCTLRRSVTSCQSCFHQMSMLTCRGGCEGDAPRLSLSKNESRKGFLQFGIATYISKLSHVNLRIWKAVT